MYFRVVTLLVLFGALIKGQIISGDFEGDNSAWTFYDKLFDTPLCTIAECGSPTIDFVVPSPTHFVWFATYEGYDQESSFAQDVVIPINTQSLTYYIRAAGSGDYQSASFIYQLTIDNTVIYSTSSANDLPGDFVEAIHDIPQYADGNSHTIEFAFVHGEVANNNFINIFIDSVALLSAVTSSAVTSSAITSSALTSSAITSSALSSSAITSSAVTSSAVTSSEVTSAFQITSSAITSSALTSSELTSSAATTSPITSSAITSSEVTSSALSTSSITTSAVTSSAMTTSPNQNLTATTSASTGIDDVQSEASFVMVSLMIAPMVLALL